MLRYRLITGPLLIVLLLGLTWFDAWAAARNDIPLGLILAAMTMVFAVLGGVEMTRLVEAGAGRPARTVFAIPAALGAAAMTACVWLSVGMQELGAGWLVVVPMLAVMLSLTCRAFGKTCDDALHGVAAAALATVWIGGGLGLLLAIYAQWGSSPTEASQGSPIVGAWMLLMVILVTKFADIGAYTAGRLFGRHKLIPWLSPGKTWEGLLGGIVLAGAVAVLLYLAVLRSDGEGSSCQWVWVALFGVLLAIGGLAGDLTVSMLKRHAGCKDSGTLLPGMGGVLDVLDSLLVTGPLAWVLLQWVDR